MKGMASISWAARNHVENVEQPPVANEGEVRAVAQGVRGVNIAYVPSNTPETAGWRAHSPTTTGLMLPTMTTLRLGAGDAGSMAATDFTVTMEWDISGNGFTEPRRGFAEVQMEYGTGTSYTLTVDRIYGQTFTAYGTATNSTKWASRVNLCLRSEELDNAVWSTTADGTGAVCTVTANDAFCPDLSTSVAEAVTFNAGASGTSYMVAPTVSVSSDIGALGGKLVFSIYIQNDLATITTMRIGIDATHYEHITVPTTGAGWFRFQTVQSPTTGNYNPYVGLADTLTSKTATVHMWGAMIEIVPAGAPSATAYITTTAARAYDLATLPPTGTYYLSAKWTDHPYGNSYHTLATAYEIK